MLSMTALCTAKGWLLLQARLAECPNQLPAREGQEQVGSKLRSDPFASTTHTSHIRDNWASLGILSVGRRDMMFMSPDYWRGLDLDFFSLTACQELGSQNENHIYMHVYHTGPQNRLNGIYWWYKSVLLHRGVFHPPSFYELATIKATLY